MSDRDFERLSGETVWEGAIVSVERARFRFTADDEEVDREIVRHPGAVGIVAHDDAHVWLVRQPREAAGDADMLEIPAGKLDHEGEEREATGRRELAEEIGKAADTWEPLVSFFTSVGVLDEQIHLYLATDLRHESADSGENERIEVIPWPLERLDEAIAQTRDSKTLVGLLMLQARLRA